jgi:hypothetical protein
MKSSTTPSETHSAVAPNHWSRDDLKIALQSAFAAGLCLGLPAGLYFWVLIVQRWAPTAQGNILLNFLQAHLVPPVTLEMLGAFGWGRCLAKISGYRLWWWLSAATMAGVWIGNFALYHGWLELNPWYQDQAVSALSLHTRFAIIVGMNVLCVTVSTGLLLGLAIMNWRAGLMMAWRTGLASVSAAMVALIILGGLNIRVGSGNLAMPKATAAATMAAALAGGAILGVVFTGYIRAGSAKYSERLS